MPKKTTRKHDITYSRIIINLLNKFCISKFYFLELFNIFKIKRISFNLN